MAIEKDILDQLLPGRDPKEVSARDGLVDELKKAVRTNTQCRKSARTFEVNIAAELGASATIGASLLTPPVTMAPTMLQLI